MTAVRTARERARAELTAEILAAARRQLAEHGAPALSLRAVARELGMASSALYRYYATRDELLTALIVEAYDDLGEAVEAAAAPASGRSPRDRFLAAARAVRSWSAAHPHQYSLLFGSPVPGFAADPERTTGPGTRVPLALLAVVVEGSGDDDGALPGPLAEQAGAVADELREGVPGVTASTLVRAALAWTSLFGLVGFERTGQLRGSFEPADALFEHAIALAADAAGLPA